MPTVRSYQRQISPAALPRVQRTAAETPESLGAGLAQSRSRTAMAGAALAYQGMEFGVGLLNRQIQESRDRADRLALTDAENKLGQWELNALNDPEKGALTLRGKNAIDADDRVREQFGKVADEIESTLNDRQKAAFARVRMQRGQSIDLTMRRHVMGEIARYEGDELKATIENGTSLAVANALDPKRVGLELGRVVSAIESHAPQLGLGPEAVKAEVAKAQTQVHTGVIDRLISLDQVKSAQIYFEETRSQIDGDQIAKIERALEQGTLLQQAQKQSDAIIATGGTLAEQRTAAKAIDDPKLRDEVLQRIEHEFNVQDRIARDQHNADVTDAYNYIDGKGASLAGLKKLSVWNTLDGAERRGLENYLESKTQGVPVKTDLVRYYELRQMADDKPEEFAKLALIKDRYRLDEGDFKRLLELQSGVKGDNAKAVAKANAKYGDNATVRQVFNDTWVQFTGLDATPTEAVKKANPGIEERIANMRRLVQIEVEKLPKDAAYEDVVSIVDRVFSITAASPGVDEGWFYFDKPTTKRLDQLTIADVPEARKTAARGVLGAQATDAQVLSWYLRYLASGGK